MRGPTLAEKASKASGQVFWGTRRHALTRRTACQSRTAQLVGHSPAGLSMTRGRADADACGAVT
jgi:hypothetical protein